jgi:hypothetical protein
MIPPVSAIQSGFTAVRRGTERLDAAAATLSTAFLPLEEGAVRPGGQDVVGALVEMMLARHQVGIGARVIERASQVDREVVDLLL